MASMFTAIDVETANPDMSSICSIGAARYEDDRLLEEWVSLINPQDCFSPINIAIHGIREDDVKGARGFGDVLNELRDMLNECVVVHHTHFDRTAMAQAARRWDVDIPHCTWLDSARVARRVWTELSRRGYGLANVCDLIGYEFDHHNALEDAKAAGQVIIAAMEITGLALPDLIGRAAAPLALQIHSSGNPSREGNPDGVLFGETIVFTGALNLVRAEAASLAASTGCNVDRNVTSKTTVLVVGDTDIRKLAGHGKSSKHRKAEGLIEQGIPIRIVGETDFMAMVAGG